MISTADWTFSSRVACRQTVTIGTSVQGRPIVAYYFGSGPTSVLFTGGIHGSEPSGTYLMEDWANYLEANPVKIPTDKQIVIVPSINPDGIAAKDRYNARGVNLDRNFPSSDWATDIAVAGGGMKAGGGGGAPASEPETQALMALTSSLKLRAVISYHAQGSLVGINEYADSDAIGNLYASAVGYKTMFYNAEETMGYTFSGEYESWIAEKLSAPAVLIELPTTNGRFLAKHLDALWKMVNL